MNPSKATRAEAGFQFIETDGKSQFDRDLENAKQYFGMRFPGDEGLTCYKCGAAVNLGWVHIAWHEATR